MHDLQRLPRLEAGALLAAGLFTSVAAMAFVALMTVAALTDHRGKGFFVFKGGWEYTAVVGVTALALAFSGPGDWSLDAVFGLDVAGIGIGLLSGAIGVGAGLILISVCRLPSKAPSGK
ncbi:hypothetical protein ABH922_005571 [Rhodococcus sp. 27YEA15]|uniref:DoxX family protein n=1 Tax=Rhodococcus sp. 27YEA15 TaxID=3156259 RepID=UPI003C7B4A03